VTSSEIDYQSATLSASAWSISIRVTR